VPQNIGSIAIIKIVHLTVNQRNALGRRTASDYKKQEQVKESPHTSILQEAHRGRGNGNKVLRLEDIFVHSELTGTSKIYGYVAF